MTRKFWTITSENTTHTNDRSTRFVTKEVAIDAARRRLLERPDITGVIVLEAVEFVRLASPPVEVTAIRPYADWSTVI